MNIQVLAIPLALLLIFSFASSNDRVGRTKTRVKLSSLEKEMYVDMRCSSTRTYIIIIFSRQISRNVDPETTHEFGK